MCRGDHWSPASLTQQCVVPEGFFTDKRARASNARPQTVEKGVLIPWPPLRGGSARRRWGRELYGCPKYFGLWQGSLPPPLRGTSLAEGGFSTRCNSRAAFPAREFYLNIERECPWHCPPQGAKGGKTADWVPIYHRLPPRGKPLVLKSLSFTRKGGFFIYNLWT